MTNWDMQDIYKYLKRGAGKQIRKEANEGCELAQSIISYYKFHYAAPGDPGAQALLMTAVTKYVGQERDRLDAWPTEAPLSLRTAAPERKQFRIYKNEARRYRAS